MQRVNGWQRVAGCCYTVAGVLLLLLCTSVAFASDYRVQSSGGGVVHTESDACIAVGSAFGSSAQVLFAWPVLFTGCSVDPVTVGASINYVDKNGAAQSLTVSALDVAVDGDVRASWLNEIVAGIGLVLCWGLGLIAGLQS